LDSPDVLNSIAVSYPELSALVILVAGLVLARVAGKLAERGLVLLNRLLARFAGDRADLIGEADLKALSRAAFWLVVLVAVLLALRTLGMGRVFTWLDAPLGYLPRILIGLAIIGAGYFLGILARAVLMRLPGAMGESPLLPRLAQVSIVVVGLMTGLKHMGLDVTFIGQLLILLLGLGIGGLALAFAIGARGYVANLVAHSLVERYSPGDEIRIGDIEGTVIEVHRTGVDLATADGIVTVPAALFAEQPVLRRTGNREVSKS
jgi:small-conductance mechanosensitive channel